MPKSESSHNLIDSQDLNPEDFVLPLTSKISELKIEKIDLTTVDGATAALVQMNNLQEEIANYQRQVKALKAILEQKKFELS
jgi:hypothetical protein